MKSSHGTKVAQVPGAVWREVELHGSLLCYIYDDSGDVAPKLQVSVY